MVVRWWFVLVAVSLCQLEDVGAEVTLQMVGENEVFMGQSAEIRCQYNISENTSMVMVQWFVNDHEGRRVRISYSDLNLQRVDENTNYTNRISIAGDSGGENLTIMDIKLSDERQFFCQVDGLAAGNKEGKFHLKVFDVPEPPVIDAVHHGVSITSSLPSKIATCETRKGFPQPNITWYRNDKPLYRENGKVNMLTLLSKDSAGLFTVQSELQYKVTKEDKDAHFFCEVSYYVPGAVRTAESKRVNINVHYPTTKIEMWRESHQDLVKEGDTVEIRCRGDGNPPPLFTFSREHSDIKLEADHDVLVLKDVNRRHSGTYHCHSLDSTDPSVMGTLKLTVHYLDPAVVVPKDSEVMQKGESLTASCNALSSLETNTVWYKNGVEIRKGNVLQLQNAMFDTAGHYNCEVTVPSLPGLHTSGSVHIIVQGPPELKDMKDVREVDVKEKVGTWVNLTCDMRGHPLPSVTWSVPDSLPHWKEIVREETEDSVHSIVTVKLTRDTDHVAICNATNSMGIETKNYTIKSIPIIFPAPQNNPVESSGVIFAVIISSILLLAILGGVIYFLHKKGKLPCGRSGKQEIINPFSTKEKTNKDDIVVEMKADKTEESVLLKGVNGNQKPPSDQ